MSSRNEIKKVQKKWLAYLFHEKRYIAQSLGKIESDHLPDYYFIYNLLISYYNHFKNIITDDMVDIYFSKKNLDANTVILYKTLISELRMMLHNNDTYVSNDAEFEALTEELNEYKRRGDWLSIAEQIANTNPLDCSTDKLEKLEEIVKKNVINITSRDGSVRDEGTISDAAKEDEAQYEYIKNNPEAIKAIPSGFTAIDDYNGGFRKSELVTVIGRKGGGKSVMLVNMSYAAWKTGHNVLIFTLEISSQDYRRRFHACAANISSNGIKMGRLEDAEEAIFKQYLANLANNQDIDGNKTGQLYIVDVPQGCNPAFIEAKLETIEQVTGVKYDVVVVDYMGIMKSNIIYTEKRIEQGEIALSLKQLAREHDVVVLTAAQMNREGEKVTEVTSANLANSDSIADHIDWGLSIRSLSETTGVINSFKVRDSKEVNFHFNKKFENMKIIELEDNLSNWDLLPQE